MDSRHYTSLDAIVDQAIILYESGKEYEAWELLDKHDIDIATIYRVFKNPHLRRKYINDYLEGY